MESGPLDGSLHRWEDIASECDWRTLFIGNGLSINIWPNFRYDTLFHFAALYPSDEALFAYEGTPNFEVVLADLNTTTNVGRLCGLDARALERVEQRYRRIQEALGNAIRRVHPEPREVPQTTLVAIREHLLEYGWVFTTSYDILLYWAMGAGPGGFRPFTDLFMHRHRGRYQFDARRAKSIPAGRTAVCFLHGALHLVVGTGGVTWKRTRGVETLLGQFDRPIPDDAQARPLLVTEGTSHDKLRAIDANDYLNHALQRLREQESALVVFGSRLGPEDQHLVDAVNENAHRPVAVSVYPRTRRDVARMKNDVFQRLEAETLLFFDSTTHPLVARASVRPDD